MKVYIKKEKLERGVIFANKVAAKKFSLPILECFLIEAKDNFLKISSTNLESGLLWQGLAKVEKEGKSCVPKKVFSNLISFLPEEKVIQLEEKESEIIVSTDSFFSKIKTLNPEDFPVIPWPQKEVFLALDSEIFEKSLKKVINLASYSTTRPEISGILVKFTPSEIFMVATDSFRLGEKKIFQENQIEKEISLILPQQAAKELLSILPPEGEIKLYPSPSQIFFEFPSLEGEFPEVQFTTRLIEGEYPNYQEIIPKKFETEAILDKEWFLNVIKTASVFCAKNNQIDLNFLVKEQEVEILSQNPEVGEFKTKIPAKIKGKDIKIAFNFKFLIDGVLGLEEKEFLFQLVNPENPTILRPLESKDYFYILMPIKI